MLRISKKADYAVFLLGSIARQGAYPGGSADLDAVVSAQEIARQANLNKSVVANLLKDFARHGLLQSTRGLKGGYRLTRSPYQVSLAAIVEVVDGPFSLVDCLRDAGDELPRDVLAGTGLAGTGLAAGGQRNGEVRNAGAHQCNLIEFCPTKSPMRVLHERIRKLFDELSLAEMCGLDGCPAIPTFPAADAAVTDRSGRHDTTPARLPSRHSSRT